MTVGTMGVSLQPHISDPRLLERQLLAAREEERRRCARELHDETLQALGVLRVQLSSALGSEDPDTLRAAVGGAVDELGREIANLRALITDLRPASLDELGLEPALGALFDRFWARHRLPVHSEVRLDCSEAGRLDAELETTIYRVVQEALTNVARHAGASSVDVEIIERRGAITIAVRDDGRGLDPLDSAAGFGLVGMHERVALLAGRLEISSSARGTTISAWLPAVREPVAPRPRKLTCL
jgi:signal transduction histidine kinase